MSKDQKVLIAVDLSAHSSTVINRARQLGDAEYHIVHVIETATGDYSFELELAHFSDYQQAHCQAVDKQLTRLLADSGLNLAGSAIHLLHGKPARSIRQLCSELAVDLLVIGSHSHSDSLTILGSTANSVMHGISCDVLTVNVS